ncbi:uncharacterized protein LOC106470213 [Limulus polyphemus]|uniref:Uncharacterized protein LOC106470213 n=1 Tax=Limulus polyphemus TaxID=6850 RepID=A0ABM1BPK4_LIMPO|nr:uncharacterized protein LOC106470213 [Limulus polyphemus]
MAETENNAPKELNPTCSLSSETSGASSVESKPSTSMVIKETCREGSSVSSNSNTILIKKFNQEVTSATGNTVEKVDVNGRSISSTLEDASDKNDCTPLDCSTEQANKDNESSKSETSCYFVSDVHISSLQDNSNGKVLVHQNVNSSNETQTWLKPSGLFVETPKNKSLIFGQFQTFTGQNYMNPYVHFNNPSLLNYKIVENINKIEYQPESSKVSSVLDGDSSNKKKTSCELRSEELNPEVLKMNSPDTVSADDSCLVPHTDELEEPIVPNTSTFEIKPTLNFSDHKKRRGTSSSTTVDSKEEVEKKFFKVDTKVNFEFQPWLNDNKKILKSDKEQDCSNKNLSGPNQEFDTKTNSVCKEHERPSFTEFKNCHIKKFNEGQSNALRDIPSPSTIIFDQNQPHSRNSESNSNSRFFDGRSFLLEDSNGQVDNYAREVDQDVTRHPRSYQCDICHMKFTQFANMRRHKLSHFGVRPFECRLCPKRFFRKDHLMEHVVRQHSLQRPFCCPFCVKSFNSRSQLKTHLSTDHSGDKLCRICGFESVSVAGAKVHYLSRHGKLNSESLESSSVSNMGIDLVQSPIERAVDLNVVSQNFVPGMLHPPVVSSNQLVDGSKSYSTHLFCVPPSLTVGSVSSSTNTFCTSSTSPVTSDTHFFCNALSSRINHNKPLDVAVASDQTTCLLGTHNIRKNIIRLDPSFKSPLSQKVLPASNATSHTNTSLTLQTDPMNVSSTETTFHHSNVSSQGNKQQVTQCSSGSEYPDTSEVSKKFVIKTEPRDASIQLIGVKMDDFSSHTIKNYDLNQEGFSSNIDNTSETSCDSGVSGDFKEKKQENSNVSDQTSRSSTSNKDEYQKVVVMSDHQKNPHTSTESLTSESPVCPRYSVRKHQPSQSSDSGCATEELANAERICRISRCTPQGSTSSDNCPGSSEDNSAANQRQTSRDVPRSQQDKYRAPSTSSTDGTAETTMHVKPDPDSVNRGNNNSQDQSLVCSHCEITFQDQTLYFLHRGLHSGSNPWKCNLCGQECRDKYHFTSHIISDAHD